MPRIRGQETATQGFTLVELAVALAIISILGLLVLSSVQQARESGRRLACASSLRQIGLALAHYQSVHSYFPTIDAPTEILADGTIISAQHFSPLARMAAQLDSQPLYDSLNFSLVPADRAFAWAHGTVLRTAVALFVCPSEGSRGAGGAAGANYRFSVGPTPWYSPRDVSPESWSGPFSAHRFYRPHDFLDGLSQTIGASERLEGDWVSNVASMGDYFLTEIGESSARGGPDWAVAACASSRMSSPLESRSGESWVLSGFHFTTYNHCATPNYGSRDCSFDPCTGSLHCRILHNGVFSARSYHPGGVNALFMDGSTRFVQDAVALPVWRAASTRSGGEISSP